MKTLLAVIATSFVLTLPAYADDAHHPEQSPGPVPAVRVSSADQGASLKKMQANVKKMQSQLDRISKAKSNEERQKLLAEHMQTMRENMMLGMNMTGGMNCPMMGGGMEMMGQGPNMMDRMQQMEKRMDMMQMMMDQVGKPQSMPAPAN